jgi:hypothetical protein
MANKFQSTIAARIGLTSFVLAGIFAPIARATDEFSSQAITFDRETSIEFTAVESHGSTLANFGVQDLNAGTKTILLEKIKSSDSKNPSVNKRNNFLGTPGNTIKPAKKVFKFQPNTPYTLYLESLNPQTGRVVSLVYSVDMRNADSSQQAKFDKNVESLTDGGIKINWLANQKKGILTDKDFNDFVVVARKP